MGVLVYAILEIKVKISTHLYETLLHKGGTRIFQRITLRQTEGTR